MVVNNKQCLYDDKLIKKPFLKLLFSEKIEEKDEVNT